MYAMALALELALGKLARTVAALVYLDAPHAMAQVGVAQIGK